jgi:hypothetical protein
VSLQRLAGSFLKLLLLTVITAIVLRAMLLGVGTYPRPELQTTESLLTGAVFLNAQYAQIATRLSVTAGIIGIALAVSAGVSVLLGYNLSRRPHSGIWDFLSFLVTIVSSTPMLIGGIVAYVLWPFVAPSEPSMPLRWQVILAGIILGIADGVMIEWPRAIRAVLAGLHQKTYFLARSARGESTFLLAMRELIPYFRESLATRVTYMFGAVGIIEYALCLKSGLVYNLFSTVRGNTSDPYCYQHLMISGMIVILVPAFVRLCLHLGYQKSQ